MKISTGQTVLLTGGTGGLGTFITRELADRGVRLASVAYPRLESQAWRQELKQKGVEAISFDLDLRVPAQRHFLLEEIYRQFGAIDLLINNAGVEFPSPLHDLSETDIDDIITVNLAAPLVLTKLVLREMLRRGRGHIVNMASLAGKSGPAFQEPYAATKAGLIAFTSSLRASYRKAGVSASVIVPGFVEAGMHANVKARSGCRAPAMLGTSAPEAVARAVVRAVEHDLPEIIVSPNPVRPLLAFSALFPRAGEWVTERTGANDFFRRVIAAQTTKAGAAR